MRVTVRAPWHPTELKEHVVQAATAFWPGASAHVEPAAKEGAAAMVIAAAEGRDALDAFRKRVWELRIIDTVRGALLRGADGSVLRFRLSKQAAFHGRVSLPPAPHALGDLDVEFMLDEGDPWADAEALAWWLCPETRDGEIVGPVA